MFCKILTERQVGTRKKEVDMVDMKKVVLFVITGLVCLVLAQIGLSLWYTLQDEGEQWIVKFYNPLIPSMAINWFAHAIAISLVVIIAVTLRYRWKFNTLISLLVASTIGILIIPFILNVIVPILVFENDDWSDFGGEYFIDYIFFEIKQSLTPEGIITSYAMTTSLAAIFGLVLGRQMIK